MNLSSRLWQLGFEMLRSCSLDALVRGYRGGFLTGGPAFFYRGLAVALLKSSDRDGEYKFLFTVIVEFYHDILFGTGKYRA
jgi:hypothetical protein